MVTRVAVAAAAGLASAARLLMLEKGEILIEGGDKLEFLYNPSSYEVEKKTKWNNADGAEGDDAQRFTFKTVESAEISFDLFFDTYENGSDVRFYTDKLFNLVKVDPRTKATQSDKARPPFCRFHWGYDSGENSDFWAYVKSVKVKYSLFLMDGTPVRASVSMVLTEVPDVNGGQNPTTEGTYGNKVHVVKPGETISLISHMYYGSSTEWRVLADANRLMDPLDIRPGQYLEIVPLEY